MDYIQAAILIPQMTRLDAKLRERQKLARRYAELNAVPAIRTPATRPGAIHALHLFPVWVDPAERDRLITELTEQQIQTVVNYRAIHLLTLFSETLGHKRGDFPIAERMGDETLSLPFYPTMPLHLVDIVVDAVVKILKKGSATDANALAAAP
jgi:dTDP-4-amino-4,6-dideoxygalactose transaminase